jgi:transposase, IS5 family
VRELERKLPAQKQAEQRENFALYRRVLSQKLHDTNRVYSLHEPHIYCVAKGKEHKKYEFGTKASLAMSKTSAVIVATRAHEQNVYDGHTLSEVLDESQAVTAQRPDKAIVDRGYRGRGSIGGTEILVAGSPLQEQQSKKERQKMRQRFRRRCAIGAGEKAT